MIQITNKLHEAIMRFSDDTVLWLKDKTNQDADVWQQIEIEEFEQHPRCMVVWPPRFGKTWGVEALCLKELACNPHEHELIIGPSSGQAKNALKENTDRIELSPILSKFIKVSRGKRQISDGRFEFANHSYAKTFGIYSAIDSEDASILRAEEWDDIDLEVWNDRVIQRGGRKNRSGLPLRIRLSGTIQVDNGPMFQYEQNPNYHVVPKFDIYDGLQFGIYDEVAIAEARAECSDEKWLRIYLLKYPSNSGFIWRSSLQKCKQKALRMGWQGVDYVPGERYRPRGTVYVGFDMGHSGEGKVHSVYRADFIEVYGSHTLWLNGFEWESTEDPDRIEREFCDYWAYYSASAGYGDALKSALIARINDRLFERGLIQSDRSEHPDNNPSSWNKWDFSPMWNTGKSKYIWASQTKTAIDHQALVIPYFDAKDDRPIARAAARLTDALLNVRQVATKSTYPSLQIIDKSVGDDPFDAINMAMGCANDRMIMPVDFSKVALTGGKTVTAGLQPSVVNELLHVGSDAGFADFGVM